MWIAAALVVSVLGAGALRHHLHARWFRLPSRRCDRLPSSDATRSEITLDEDGVQLPAATFAGQSVMLRLTLRARLLGVLFDPYIEIRAGRGVTRQYFERGASGERYLNLSSVFQGHEIPAAASHVSLRSRGLRWETNGTLESFSAPRLEGARILVLAPHPDDAELAALGTYAGRDAWVVTITAGERASKTSAGQPRRRIEESLEVPRLASIRPEHIVSLAYPDGALAAMYRDPSAVFRLACEESQPRAGLRALNTVPQFRLAQADCRWTELIDELRALLDHVRPDIVVAPHPLLDSHPDHVYTAVALEAAMRNSGTFPELFLFAVHIAGAPMHPPGDLDSMVGLPPLRHDEWIAEQIHSQPLDADLRLTKRRSLLAMSAVRESAGLEPAAFGRESGLFRWLNRLAGLGAYPASLLRRADRPNEIYYRVHGQRLAALLERLPAGDA
jgi:LmbE family N-acetylglucosaminyl deacetylase